MSDIEPFSENTPSKYVLTYGSCRPSIMSLDDLRQLFYSFVVLHLVVENAQQFAAAVVKSCSLTILEVIVDRKHLAAKPAAHAIHARDKGIVVVRAVMRACGSSFRQIGHSCSSDRHDFETFAGNGVVELAKDGLRSSRRYDCCFQKSAPLQVV